MRYIFFLISFLYSTIFFLFYKLISNNKNVISLSFNDSIILSNKDQIIIQSFFWNLLIESIIFFIIGIFLFVYFSPYKSYQNHSHGESLDLMSYFTKENIFFVIKKFSYYIGFLFFYFSLYLMSLSFELINFSIFVIILNIIIISYFFASKYSKLSSDFLKVNSILFSLSYIFLYFYIVLTQVNIFWYIDILNSIFIIFSFVTFLYFDKLKNKKKMYDEVILLNLVIYIFVVFLFYSYHYLLHENLLYWLTILSTIFWISLFEYIPKIKVLNSNKLTFKYIWIIFSYLWILYWIIYLLSTSFSFLIYLVLLIQIWYNIFIHMKYLNLVSLTISLFLIIFLTYYLIFYFRIFDYKSILFLVFSLIFSFLMIGSTYYLKLKTIIDNYLIHSFSYFVNIMSIIIFLTFNYKSVEIFYIWLLFFVESIFFFFIF
jgi:hypothetical protein